MADVENRDTERDNNQNGPVCNAKNDAIAPPRSGDKKQLDNDPNQNNNDRLTGRVDVDSDHRESSTSESSSSAAEEENETSRLLVDYVTANNRDPELPHLSGDRGDENANSSPTHTADTSEQSAPLLSPDIAQSSPQTTTNKETNVRGADTRLITGEDDDDDEDEEVSEIMSGTDHDSPVQGLVSLAADEEEGPETRAADAGGAGGGAGVYRRLDTVEEADEGDEVVNMWFDVVAAGNVDRMKEMLAEEFNINSSNQDGQSALHVVARRHGDVGMAKFLIDEGVSVNHQGKNGETAIHLAARKGDVSMSKNLIAAGADVTLTLSNGCTTLHCACQAGSAELVTLLLDNSADVEAGRSTGGVQGITPLHDATERGDLQTLKTLLARGANVDPEASNYCTPLHYASRYGYDDIVSELVSVGAEVSRSGVDGRGTDVQPIHLAAEHNHPKLVRILATSGADVNATRVYLGKTQVTCLHLAALKHHVELARTLLELDCDVNAQDDDGNTALHIATRQSHVTIAKLLLSKEVDLTLGSSSRQSHRQTPLHNAVRFRNMELMEMIIEKGCDVNAAEKMELRQGSPSKDADSSGDQEVAMVDGYTALHWAAENGDTEMVRYLIEKGANPKKIASFETHSGVTPLHLAAQDGHSEVVEELLKHAKVERNPRKSTLNRENITPLHQAVFNGHVDTVRLLLTSDVDVNSQADNGYTSLHYAAQQGHVPMLQLLLDQGALVNLSASDKKQTGLSPLHLAVQSGNCDAVKLLVEAGCDLTAGKVMNDISGVTPFHQAVYQKKLDVVRTLVTLGGDVNASMNGWYAPLHIAAERGCKEILLELLRNSADVNQTATHGDHIELTPLHCASQHGHADLVQTLVSAGADINARRTFVDRDRIAPLHLAAENGFLEAVKMLLQLGCERDAQDNVGFTALHLAVQYNYPEIISELLSGLSSIRKKTINGLTAQKLAEDMGEFVIVNMFKEEKKRRKAESIEIPGDAKNRSGGIFSFLCGLNKETDT